MSALGLLIHQLSLAGRHGVGLSSMAARANEVGGFVTTGPLRGRGFRVTVTLPRTQLTQPSTDPSATPESVPHGDGLSSKQPPAVTGEEAEQCQSR